MNGEYIIYALSDPRFPKIVKYVGATRKRLRSRWLYHCSIGRHQKRRKKKNKCAIWLGELHAAGLKPFVKKLERCSYFDVEEVEAKWVKHFSELGELVNAERHARYNHQITPCGTLSRMDLQKYEQLAEARKFQEAKWPGTSGPLSELETQMEKHKQMVEMLFGPLKYTRRMSAHTNL